jgi:DNA (cytosine-5)-methyltransferase 1
MPFLTRYNGGENRNSSADQPMPVIDTANRYAVISPLFVPQHECGTVKPTDQPLSTIATSGAIGLVTPFLMEYYKNGRPVGVDQPIPTISTKDRFGVAQGRILTLPDGRRYQLDIAHRMLTTRELADATGFDHDYVFQGTDTDAKKQIGNAVPPPLARALYLAVLEA